MKDRERALGKTVRFLLPSLKLKQPRNGGSNVEHGVHLFLTQRFGGYTATSANLFGYWKDAEGMDSYGEHREFTVALAEDGCLDELKTFLGKTACDLREECLYLEVAGEAALVYADDADEPQTGH